ncbi:MAG: hypothetical protein LBI39_00700 [Puniceicoccales bacterium]|nr:hypothetical protein [Puniceicoccales bacterium]
MQHTANGKVPLRDRDFFGRISVANWIFRTASAHFAKSSGGAGDYNGVTFSSG